MDRNAILQVVVFHDAPEVLLVGTISDHDDLQAEVGVVLGQLEEDISEELAAFLDGIEA